VRLVVHRCASVPLPGLRDHHQPASIVLRAIQTPCRGGHRVVSRCVAARWTEHEGLARGTYTGTTPFDGRDLGQAVQGPCRRVAQLGVGTAWCSASGRFPGSGTTALGLSSALGGRQGCPSGSAAAAMGGGASSRLVPRSALIGILHRSMAVSRCCPQAE